MEGVQKVVCDKTRNRFPLEKPVTSVEASWMAERSSRAVSSRALKKIEGPAEALGPFQQYQRRDVGSWNK